MPFPFSARATVEVREPSCELEATLLRLTAFLEAEHASEIRREGQSLNFASDWSQLSDCRWNLLAPISSGRLSLRDNGTTLSIHYDIRFTRMLIVVTVVVLCFFGPVFYEDPEMAAGDKAATLLSMWAALFGGNYVICILSFPSLLQAAAVKATKAESDSGNEDAPVRVDAESPAKPRRRLEGMCADGTVHH